jgi:hypothetical protein
LAREALNLGDTPLFWYVLNASMEKVVRKFESWEAADEADLEYWAGLSGDEKLAILLDLIAPENPDEAVIQRCARVYPLGEGSRG